MSKELKVILTQVYFEKPQLAELLEDKNNKEIIDTFRSMGFEQEANNLIEGFEKELANSPESGLVEVELVQIPPPSLKTI